jgi:hypothetical protein
VPPARPTAVSTPRAPSTAALFRPLRYIHPGSLFWPPDRLPSAVKTTPPRNALTFPPLFSPGASLLAGAPPAALPRATSRRARPGPRRAMKTCSPPWRAGW